MSLKSYIRHVMHEVRPKRVVKASVVSVNQTDLLLNKYAFITGGTSGIGFAIAKAFLCSGGSVVIAARRKDKIVESVDDLSRFLRPNQAIKGVILDCSNPQSFPNVLEQAEEEIGCSCFDILVNNAGVGGGQWGHCDEEDFDRVMDTNLKGAFFLSQLVAKRMVDKNVKGNILNVASSSAIRPAASAYMVSKWGLRGLTVGLAKSLIPHGIVVNGIAPGPTATPMLAHDQNDIYLPTNPAGRFVMPEEIANFAVMLCSQAGRMVVGDILYITGGSGVTTFDDITYNI